MILLAFDVDGTLDCSAGPVPVALLGAIHHGGDAAVVIVSPSPAYSGGLPRHSHLQERRQNLAAAATMFPAARVRIYVSDNKDYAEAEAAGFCYVEAAEFAKGIP